MAVTVKWKLQHTESGEITAIEKPVFKIGRHPASDISTKNEWISRNHAMLTVLVGDALHVQDLGSSNGTFVNGAQITSNELLPLNDGDILNFGNYTNYTYKVLKDSGLPSPVQVVEEPHTSTKDQETKENMPAVVKIEEPTAGNSSQFSSCFDDCIVISDEEDDDDPFAMSQIFQITEKVKNESCLDDDPYIEIKKELADLDYCDPFGESMHDPIDLEPFENTEELLDILESSAREKKSDTEKKTAEKANSSVKTIDVSEGEIRIGKKDPTERPRRSSSKQLTVVLKHTPTDSKEKSERRKSADLGKKKDIDTEMESPISRKSTDKNESSAYMSKSKFKVPPVVEAHTVEFDRNKLRSKEKANKETVKRRASIDVPIVEKKLKVATRSRTSTPRKSKGSDRLSLDKSTKEVIKEIRKQKLKELGEKQSEDKPVDKAKVVTSVPKVKDPRRGNFLLDEPPPINHTIKTPSERPKRSIEGSKRSIEGPKSRSSEGQIRSSERPKIEMQVERRGLPSTSAALDPKDSEIQDMTITSQLSPSDQLTQKIPVMHSKSKPPRANLDYIPMSEFMSKTQARPDSTMQERRTKWPQNHVFRELDSVDEYISQIVFWNVRWVLEQKDQEISPPINKYNEEMVPLEFPSVEKYVHVMQPLIMLELWNYIYTSCTNTNRKPFLASLVHARHIGELSYFDCECYLPEKCGTTLKPDDFILIECKLIDNQNVTYQFTGFGYIKYCGRIDNTREGHSKSPNIRFTLVTRSFDKRVSGKQVLIKMADNIANFLRLLKTMKYLKSSPLIKNILDPRIEDYRIRVENKDLNVKENKLNERQREAVLEARQVCLGNEPKIYLMKGPPGTGKSTVITSLILDLIFNVKSGDTDPLILLTAPSNAAVDSLIGKLALARQKIRDEKKRKKVRIVRVGPESSINSNVEKFKLSTLVRNNMITDYRLNECTEYQKYSDANKLDEFVRMKLANKYYYEQKRLEDVVLKRSNVICTTLQSCTHNKILHSWRSGGLRSFTCCIIDEATQCTELESLLPIQLGITKFVLVGDPKQLPAVVTNREASKLGLGMSLFSRIEEKFRNVPKSPVKLLEIQYRMASAICEYPNQAFYEGKMRSMPKCDNPIQPPPRPYMLFNLTRTQNNDESEFTNMNEVRFICKILETLKTHVKQQCFYSVGVIAPYRAQIDLLRREISDIKFPPEATITVNTVDSFQGAECDVIIISCVRLNSNCFLQNEQRLNVALTRAKQALYVVGNYSLFKHCKPLYDLRENAKSRRLCFDIRENPKDMPLLHKLIFT
ncbi:unnamed protein product [Callosobruchus maculatus]|uniref:FHA domain-containing protein n=1 Tax=Callosobruchus maculatus TaxID=64391 RepID=A0A653BZR1_CALMS|nr:unnamed protein product [Callosobruchus maculatus]